MIHPIPFAGSTLIDLQATNGLGQPFNKILDDRELRKDTVLTVETINSRKLGDHFLSIKTNPRENNSFETKSTTALDEAVTGFLKDNDIEHSFSTNNEPDELDMINFYKKYQRSQH